MEYDGTTALDEAEDYPTSIWDEKNRLRSLSYDVYSRLTSASDFSGTENFETVAALGSTQKRDS